MLTEIEIKYSCGHKKNNTIFGHMDRDNKDKIISQLSKSECDDCAFMDIEIEQACGCVFKKNMQKNEIAKWLHENHQEIKESFCKKCINECSNSKN